MTQDAASFALRITCKFVELSYTTPCRSGKSLSFPWSDSVSLGLENIMFPHVVFIINMLANIGWLCRANKEKRAGLQQKLHGIRSVGSRGVYRDYIFRSENKLYDLEGILTCLVLITLKSIDKLKR